MNLKIIDLFAGIGGIRMAFEQAGEQLGNKIKCVMSSEIDKFAIETYQINFGNHFVFGDITKINNEDIPDHDILLAGFPCQPFSQAGLKAGFFDTRGTLFFEIERILKHKKPKAFLLENVKHLKNHDKGKTLKIILEALQKIGYHVSFEVLNAKNFGLPQNRERIFIVGFLDQVNFIFPKPQNINTKVGDILENNVDHKYTITDKIWAGHQRRKTEHANKGNGFGYSLYNENSPYTSTISARYYKDGSEALIEQIGKNPRMLTPRECARLQGFPDHFVLHKSKKQAYQQIGNSVSVPVIRQIAKNILEILNKNVDKNKFLSKNVSKNEVFDRTSCILV